MDLDLIRLRTDPTVGTLGILRIDGILKFTTLEPYKFGNIRNKSCIPLSQYVLKHYSSAKYKNTLEVCSVPNRGNILFHSGNTILDTKGCILLGMKFGTLYGKDAVLESRKALTEFKAIIKAKENLKLTIIESF